MTAEKKRKRKNADFLSKSAFFSESASIGVLLSAADMPDHHPFVF